MKVSNSVDDRVVLTGCGWITPFAAGSIGDILDAAESRWRLQSSESTDRVGTPTAPVGEAYWAVPDERLGDYPSFSKELRSDKGAWMTAAALEHACQDASLQLESLDGVRLGLVLGCSLAGQLGMIEFANEVRQQSMRFVSPIHFPQTVGNYIAGALARSYGIRGPNATLASGAASGLDAIIEACGLLISSQADVILAGGTEPLSQALAESLREPSVVLSEGACLFVLERSNYAAARNARPLATVSRWEHLPARSTVKGTDHGAPGSVSTRSGVAETARAEARGSGIVSVAGCRQPGAVYIEEWVGRCPGASGAVAVAAAIAAARQRELPIVNSTDLGSTSVKPVAIEDLRTANGTIPATIIADADGAYRTLLELTVPGRI